MIQVVELARGAGFTVGAVRCGGAGDVDAARWSSVEAREGYDIVLVRAGRFRRRADGVAADIDVTTAYVGGPGAEEQFAHPAGGDRCTWIGLDPARWDTLAGDRLSRSGSTLYVDAAVELAHRRLAALTCRHRSGGGREPAAAGQTPAVSTPPEPIAAAPAVTGGATTGSAAARFAAPPAEEPLLDLVAALLGRLGRGPGPADVPPAPADRALAARAREAVLADLPASAALLPLAQHLGVSPFRLSRAFSREVGVSLSHYRNRVRVGRALARIEAGEEHLGRLAADLGFADQAHFTRTARRHLGRPPTALRRLLNP